MTQQIAPTLGLLLIQRPMQNWKCRLLSANRNNEEIEITAATLPVVVLDGLKPLAIMH